MQKIVMFVSIVIIGFAPIFTIVGCGGLKEKSISSEFQDISLAKNNIEESLNIVETSKAYLPTIDIVPSQIKYVSNTKELQKAINMAKEGDTITLKDGFYEGVVIKNKRYLTLKSENRHKASISSSGEGAIKISNSSYINILGLEGTDATYFVFAPSWKSSVDHIYIHDCKIHDQRAGIYSGVNSHDWTVDSCEIYNLNYSYAWYSLGYHHTLQNSKLYKINNFYINIRGYFPLGELNKGDYPLYDHPPLKDREPSSYRRLDSSDWTHLVVNNIFGEGVKNFTREKFRGAGIGFYIGGKNSHDEDEYYLPPQNVIIENNIFYNNHGDGAIFMDEEYGFSQNDPSHGFPILGTVIKNNVTNENNIITIQYHPDIKMIDMRDNLEGIDDTKILKLIEEKNIKLNNFI